MMITFRSHLLTLGATILLSAAIAISFIHKGAPAESSASMPAHVSAALLNHVEAILLDLIHIVVIVVCVALLNRTAAAF